MVIAPLYKFRESVSIDAYSDKKISGAMIGSSKDKKNREIREEYGFSASKGVGFKEEECTIGSLYQAALSGRVFCHLFDPKETRTDSTFGSSQKTDSNFRGSYVIGIDIDKTSYRTAREFINTLQMKPSFWYSTYSNQLSGKGARFRMIYVFSELIENKFFFRYVASQLNSYIEQATGEKIEDDCNLRCSQYFNGTNIKAPNLIVEHGATNLVYDLADFDVTVTGFKSYLENNCGYKTNTHREEIKSLLGWLNETYFPESLSSLPSLPEKKEEVEKEPLVSKNLLCDMKKLPYDAFMKYHRHEFTYIYRQEGSDWTNGYYQKVDSSYFQLYFNATKVLDGNSRRKKLYQRMCLRRVMKPEITATELLLNAYEDLNKFFENDPSKVSNVITPDELLKNTEWAMSKTIEEIEEDFSETLAILRSNAPKKGLIFKTSERHHRSLQSQALKEILESNWNSELSISENIDYISSNFAPVKKSFVYAWLKETGRKADTSKLSDTEVLNLLDTSLSGMDNFRNLKSKGIKISRNRVAALLHQKEAAINEEKKETVIIELPLEKKNYSHDYTTSNNTNPLGFNSCNLMYG